MKINQPHATLRNILTNERPLNHSDNQRELQLVQRANYRDWKYGAVRDIHWNLS